MLPLLLLACAPALPDSAGGGNGSSGGASGSLVQLDPADTGPVADGGLRGWLTLAVGFREAAPGDRDCTLAWTVDTAVPMGRCPACAAAFDLVWALDAAASAPGEHCAPVEGPLEMALGLAPGSATPLWTGPRGGTLRPWEPAAALVEEDGGWRIEVGTADVERPDGGHDTALWTGWVALD